MTPASFASQQGKPLVVYHDGSRILFTPQITGRLRMAKLGRWDLGERLKDGKLRERRLNLYVVFPGRQDRSVPHSRYNHTLIIHQNTINGKPAQGDILRCLGPRPS